MSLLLGECEELLAHSKFNPLSSWLYREPHLQLQNIRICPKTRKSERNFIGREAIRIGVPREKQRQKALDRSLEKCCYGSHLRESCLTGPAPFHETKCQFDRLSFLKSAANRGSLCKLLSRGSTFVKINPSLCLA
jgi:hypothetical protein